MVLCIARNFENNMRSLKIIFLSHSFAPAIGGIEASSVLLADVFAKRGHEVIIMTMTKGPNTAGLPYKVVRNPGLLLMLKYHAWADIVYENNPCLRLGWPKLLFGNPSVIALHTWITRSDGSVSLIDKIKLYWLAKANKVIAVSKEIQNRCWPKAIVIGNSFNSDLFKIRHLNRKKDFVFLGRLVSDKGADLAIRAFADMAFFNPLASLADADLTIIGAGPEQVHLENLAAALPDPNRIKFVGSLTGNELVDELNRHSFMFIPSIWEEPFGIVALEGIACGLIPIASDGGGLPDAVGRAGVIFRRGKLDSLIQVSTNLVTSDILQSKCLSAAPAHLDRFSSSTVTNAFINVLETVV